ncbi:MAG: hypothetical protein AB1Z23_06375 [Eubacteriales bacterium]
MIYLKKFMKVLALTFAACILLFSTFSISASAIEAQISFNPIITLIATVPPTFVFTYIPFGTPAPSDTSSLVYFSDTKLRDALVAELGVAPNQLTENYLSSLTGTLDLSGYGITTLQGIESLDHLDYLILRNNEVYSKHEVKRLAQLTNLEALDISALSITELPSEIGNMTNLKYLDISANRIESIPSSFSNLSLDVLLCNYCYLDIQDPGFISTLIASTATADYQYQLQKLEFYLTCETAGTVTAIWESIPDIEFPNGAIAHVQRYSICEPTLNGSQGSWIDSESSSKTSHTYTGLTPSKTYYFSISADYYIKNTIYDGKYIKYYVRESIQPIPQDTPTPKPTDTPEPTATLVVTDTPAPLTAEPATSTPMPFTATATSYQNGGNSSGNSLLTVLLIIVVVLVVALIGVIIFFFTKMSGPPRGENRDNIQPPPEK